MEILQLLESMANNVHHHDNYLQIKQIFDNKIATVTKLEMSSVSANETDVVCL